MNATLGRGADDAQMQMDFSGVPSKADDLMQRAYAWVLDNPNAWIYIEDRAAADAQEGRIVRIKRYIEELRDDPTVRHSGTCVKLPNAFSAPLGRFLVAWNEELQPYVPLAHSKVDGCSIPARPITVEWNRL